MTILSFFTAQFCHAQCDSCNDTPATKTWEGDVSTDWNDGNNWSGNTIPTTESVTIDGTAYTNAPIISTNSTFSPADVFIIDGATLTVQADLTLTDDFVIRNNSFLVIEGGSNATGDDINLCSGGTISMDGGALDNTSGSGIVRICTSQPVGATGNTEIIINDGTFDSTTSDTEGATTISDFVTVTGGGSYSDDGGILPVDLLSFSAYESDQGVLLQWTTASELNNSHFEIQRSKEGRTFETIGSQKGHGTTNEQQQYEFLDKSPHRENYYRLKQVDYDGKFEIFDAIHLSPKKVPLFAIQTLSRQSNQLQISSPEVFSTVKIYTLSGVVMHEKRDESSFNVDTSSWSAGLYVVKMVWSGQSQTAKLSIR